MAEDLSTAAKHVVVASTQWQVTPCTPAFRMVERPLSRQAVQRRSASAAQEPTGTARTRRSFQ